MCPEGDLYRHDPPKVYDIATDPYELYPLSQKQQPEKILAVVEALVTSHVDTIGNVTELVRVDDFFMQKMTKLRTFSFYKNKVCF